APENRRQRLCSLRDSARDGIPPPPYRRWLRVRRGNHRRVVPARTSPPELRPGHSDELCRGLSRVEQRPEDVEDRALTALSAKLSGCCDLLERRVKSRGEEEC